jgi:hypothetical protein
LASEAKGRGFDPRQPRHPSADSAQQNRASRQPSGLAFLFLTQLAHPQALDL